MLARRCEKIGQIERRWRSGKDSAFVALDISKQNAAIVRHSSAKNSGHFRKFLRHLVARKSGLAVPPGSAPDDGGSDAKVWQTSDATQRSIDGAATIRARLVKHISVAAVSYTHLTLPTNREV